MPAALEAFTSVPSTLSASRPFIRTLFTSDSKQHLSTSFVLGLTALIFHFLEFSGSTKQAASGSSTTYRSLLHLPCFACHLAVTCLPRVRRKHLPFTLGLQCRLFKQKRMFFKSGAIRPPPRPYIPHILTLINRRERPAIIRRDIDKLGAPFVTARLRCSSWILLVSQHNNATGAGSNRAK